MRVVHGHTDTLRSDGMGSRHREFVTDEHGQRMQVIRPKDPKLAVEMALQAHAKNDTALFERLPALVEDAAGEPQYMGLLARRENGTHCIVDDDGKFVAELAPGDSFVTGLKDVGSG